MWWPGIFDFYVKNEKIRACCLGSHTMEAQKGGDDFFYFQPSGEKRNLSTYPHIQIYYINLVCVSYDR